jgi:hypothetical protein
MSRFLVALFSALSVAACSSQSPVTPSAAPVAEGSLSARGSQAAPGIYELSFHAWLGGVLQEVSSLSVGSQELILRAHVTDSSGAPAQRGTVTFEYCSYKGLPSNDITRPDEAPKEACEQGSADWARLTSLPINSGCPTFGAGNACMNFGFVRIPRVVGFRFRYSPQGSGIAAGVSLSKDFTWVE